MIRKLSISVVLMLLVVVAKAQVTLCEYVESVIAHSYTLANAESVVDGSVAESGVARRGLLPELSLSSDVDMGFRSDRLGWGVRADVSQPIYNGGRYRGIAKQSESLVDVAESARDMCRLDVRYGANDLPMLNSAGLGIAFHAKPKVRANARQSLSTVGIDGILYFLGLKDSWVEKK